MKECSIPLCHAPVKARGICERHYNHQLGGYRDAHEIRRYMSESVNVERWVCHCPDARHDDWECPTCHRPSFSQERIQALRGRRLGSVA